MKLKTPGVEVGVKVAVTIGVGVPVAVARGVAVGTTGTVAVGVGVTGFASAVGVGVCAAPKTGAKQAKTKSGANQALKANGFFTYFNSAKTAAPISEQVTAFSPLPARSAVRRPLSKTFSTAASMASDSF